MITQADVYDAVPGFVSSVMFYVRGTFTGWFPCVFAEPEQISVFDMKLTSGEDKS